MTEFLNASYATARKIAALRLFPGATPMDRTLADVGGACLVISQFTLAGSLRKGNRPSLTDAEDPALASGDGMAGHEAFGNAAQPLSDRIQNGPFDAAGIEQNGGMIGQPNHPIRHRIAGRGDQHRIACGAWWRFNGPDDPSVLGSRQHRPACRNLEDPWRRRRVTDRCRLAEGRRDVPGSDQGSGRRR